MQSINWELGDGVGVRSDPSMVSIGDSYEPLADGLHIFLMILVQEIMTALILLLSVRTEVLLINLRAVIIGEVRMITTAQATH